MKLVTAPATCSVEPLRRAELPVDTIELAQYLIGKTLVHKLPTARLSGVIVETEGYPPGDAAGHAFRGKTRGNQSLFLGRGYCYVYFTYGSSFMVNVTSEKQGVGAGVLAGPTSAKCHKQTLTFLQCSIENTGDAQIHGSQWSV